MRFEFSTASRILFGPGTVAEVPGAAQSLGRRALVAFGSIEHAAPFMESLHASHVEPIPCPVTTEPTIASVLESVQLAREGGCDLVIGMGGGSTLDTGKTVAALLTNPGDLLDYLEVIGKGKSLNQPSAGYIAIPTTAGTGSEVTRNAVLRVPEQQIKVSLRSPFLLPRLAVIDPDLTLSLDPQTTASTGLDALTQLIEPFVSITANPLTDSICREGIRMATRSLLRASRDGKNRDARRDMSLASMLGGMALANASLGAVHGFAASIGGACAAPHGAICARLLPLVMETNFRALKSRQHNSPALERYREIARIATGNALATAEDGIKWISRLVHSLGIPPLSKYDLTPDMHPMIVEQAKKSGSMRGNPVALTDDELFRILIKAG